MRFKNADFESAEEVIYQFLSFLWTKLIISITCIIVVSEKPPWVVGNTVCIA